MERFLYLVIVFTLLAGCASPKPNLETSALIFYAAANPSGMQNGTLDNPWAWSTIDEKILSGDIPYGSTVKLKDSFKNIEIGPRYSGSSFADSGRMFYDGSLATFDTSTDFNFDDLTAVINIVSAKNITVKGFDIGKTGEYRASNQSETPIGINVEGNAVGVKIEGNKIHNFFSFHETNCHSEALENCGNAHGIHVKEASDKRIRNIWITDNTLYNLDLGSSEALVVNGNVNLFYILRNRIYNVNNIAIDAIGFEENMPFAATRGFIEDNYISQVDARGSTTAGEQGFITNAAIPKNQAYFNIANDATEESASCIYVDGGQDIDIRRNRLIQCNLGISISSEYIANGLARGKEAKDIVVANNTITGNSVTGIKLGSGSAREDGVDNCWVLNNTLRSNDKTDTPLDNDHDGIGEIWLEFNVSHCQIINNIFSANSLGGTVLSNTRSTSVANANEFERNVYYHKDRATIIDTYCLWGPTSVPALTDCLRSTRFNDATGTYVNPRLASNLGLTINSPSTVVNNALTLFNGVNLLPLMGNLDVFGGPRKLPGNALDIGADERQ